MSGHDAVRSSLRSGLQLALAGLVAAALLTLIWSLTRDSIEESQRRAALALLNVVIPDALHDNDLLADTLQIEDAEQLGHREPVTVYRGWLAGEPSALAFEVIARDGYSGDIRLLIGIAVDGTLTGVRVIAHRETPGLGDWIEATRSDWILSFSGGSLDNPPPEQWRVKRDGGEFDQFTGATVTPRAVVRQIADTLVWYQEQRTQLWQPAVEESK